MKKKEEPNYSDFNSTMERVRAENERYENASAEYKVLHNILKHLSNAIYGIKYKSINKEGILLELAEAKGEVVTLGLMSLDKSKDEK